MSAVECLLVCFGAACFALAMFALAAWQIGGRLIKRGLAGFLAGVAAAPGGVDLLRDALPRALTHRIMCDVCGESALRDLRAIKPEPS